MTSYRKKLRAFLIKHFDQFEKWRWVVLVSIGLGLFSAEVYEFIELSFLNQPLHIGEVFLYAALLICAGLFLELFVRLNRVQKRMVKILEYKHNLGMELTVINDWDLLTAKLAELPGRIVQADEAYLMVSNLFSNEFEALSHWSNIEPTQQTEIWDACAPCEKCFQKISDHNSQLHLCRNDNDKSPSLAYSLSILKKNSPPVFLKFRPKPGLQLSSNEEKIFLNISDEIAIAIRVGRDLLRLKELQAAETAMAERRAVSTFVHDQLGQNLGYLHLKLDQLSTNEDMISSQEVRKELKSLREVANESYEIVRDILKKLQPETIPHLTNLLMEHARKISQAANFTLEFKSMGNPVELPSETRRAIFYAFQEILSNVERHSKANIVNVLVTWNDSYLDVTVADNGIGFNPDLVNRNEHFGLDILQERIAGLKGQFMIDSSANSGTIISISVPVKSLIEETHEQ
jgi:signal transduction histidine kinase